MMKFIFSMMKLTNFIYCIFFLGTVSAQLISVHGINSIERNTIINIHNQERQLVCLPPLQWDDHLATLAQSYSEQCRMAHSANGYGENLFGGSLPFATFSRAVYSWADEKFMWRCGQCCDLGTGHYTQIVWHQTTHLGCGASICNYNGYNMLWVVCNYSPSGNRGPPPFPIENCNGCANRTTMVTTPQTPLLTAPPTPPLTPPPTPPPTPHLTLPPTTPPTLPPLTPPPTLPPLTPPPTLPPLTPPPTLPPLTLPPTPPPLTLPPTPPPLTLPPTLPPTHPLTTLLTPTTSIPVTPMQTKSYFEEYRVTLITTFVFFSLFGIGICFYSGLYLKFKTLQSDIEMQQQPPLEEGTDTIPSSGLSRNREIKIIDSSEDSEEEFIKTMIDMSPKLTRREIKRRLAMSRYYKT